MHHEGFLLPDYTRRRQVQNRHLNFQLQTPGPGHQSTHTPPRCGTSSPLRTWRHGVLYRLQLLQLVPNFRRHRDLGEREKSTHHGSNATMGDFSLAHYDLISQHNGRSRSRSRPTDRPTDRRPSAGPPAAEPGPTEWLVACCATSKQG